MSGDWLVVGLRIAWTRTVKFCCAALSITGSTFLRDAKLGKCHDI